MSDGHEPVEESDGSIIVHILKDDRARQEVRCHSYKDAIDVVKQRHVTATVVKIEDRDGDIVFTSAEMDIANWETEWKHAKRRLSVDVEDWDCPYESMACFADDLCVQCKMDKVQDQY